MNETTIGIVGAGQMGSGIAQVFAAAGFHVLMNDVDAKALERGLSVISANLDRMVLKEKISAETACATLAKIKGTVNITDFSDCDFLIEAATENVSIKESILRDLDRVSKPDSIIATNTSSVSITKLASCLSDPKRFVGMHFFNPVPVMSLVEIIRGVQTANSTFESTIALTARLGKTPISVKNAPGFVVNRILIPMINEAIFVLQEGLATAEEIDKGMCCGANHPIGPLALADLIGLDTILFIMEVFYRDLCDPKYRPAPLLREMVNAGYLGRKSKKGFFNY